MTTLGIDPGKNGGIAWITDGNPCVEKIPDTIKDLWDLIESIRMSACIAGGGIHQTGVIAYLEQVNAMPGQGVTSCFTFGQGFGHLEMALTAAGIPFVRVRPQVWQKAMGCLTKGDKRITKRRAQELFPSLKVNHYIADALLIAKYGATQLP